MSPTIHILNGSSVALLPELAAVAENAARVFGMPVFARRMEPELRPAYDPMRGQHNSTRILSAFLERPHPGDDKHLLVVDVDLFIPVLTFVFGEAEFGGTAAIVSTHRLSNRYYGLPGNHRLLIGRLEKEIIHELGHTFGLFHCRQFECVMRSSTYVGEIDVKKATPCPDCAAMLREIYAGP